MPMCCNIFEGNIYVCFIKHCCCLVLVRCLRGCSLAYVVPVPKACVSVVQSVAVPFKNSITRVLCKFVYAT